MSGLVVHSAWEKAKPKPEIAVNSRIFFTETSLGNNAP